MTTRWVKYVKGVAIEGDIVKADVYKDNTLERVELCGQIGESKVWWWCTALGDNTRKIHEDQIRLINVNIDYYNRRIRLCNKYERINNEQREIFEAKKMELMRKEKLHERAKKR